MKPLECVDFGCDGKNAAGRCSLFWTCLVRLADHLAYLSMVALGCCFFIAVGLIVNAGHAEPAVMTLVTTLTGLFAGMIYTIRQRLDRVEDKKQIKEAAVKQEETKVAVENKLEQVVQKLEPIRQDVKAAAVAGKFSVKQNVELLDVAAEIRTNVNGGKKDAVEAAFQAGLEKGRDDSKH